MKKINLKALLAGFIVRLAITTSMGAVFYLVLSRFMLMLGTPSFFLYERYLYSPLGVFLGAVTAITGYLGMGYVISNIAKDSPFMNITIFLILEYIVFMFAAGLNIPGYPKHFSINFIEMLIYLLTVGAAYTGALLVKRDDLF